MDDMNDLMKKMIRERKSVRTYDGHALRTADVQKIETYCKSLQNPFGIPVEFRVLEGKHEPLSSPVILGADTWLGAKVARVPNAEIAFGYDFEKAALYARSLGIGTVWLAATIDRPSFERAMEVKENEVMPAVTPLGYPASKKSVREALMRKALKADRRLSFESLFFKDSFCNPLTPKDAGCFREALEMARLSPSAGNKQPWRIVICGDTAHFYEKKTMTPNKLGDIQKVDVGIALSHFALVMEAAGAEIEYCTKAPDLSIEADMEYLVSCRVK